MEKLRLLRESHQKEIDRLDNTLAQVRDLTATIKKSIEWI